MGSRRGPSYISDVAPVIARSVTVKRALNQIFNLGADTPTTVNRLAEVVQEAMGRRTGVLHLPARKEVVHAFSDHSKIGRVFGKRPHLGLEEGVARMAAWVKQVGPRGSRPFRGIEIERNLPPSWRPRSPNARG